MAETEYARPEDKRPLSPHLQVYKLSLTMAMSMAHRLSGVALYAGTMLLACFFMSAANGERAFEGVMRFLFSPIGLVLMFGYTWALFHHLLGGVRHAIWDAGYGMDPVGREFLARATAIGGIGLTIVVWIIALLVKA